MKDIIIKKLTSELKDDYLEFFDFRAFSDGNIQKGCYCVWHHWTEINVSHCHLFVFTFFHGKSVIKLYNYDILGSNYIYEQKIR